MTAPVARRGSLSDAELANFSVSRSGASVTVRCWKQHADGEIIMRYNTINLDNLLKAVERHWQVHHADPADVAEQPKRLGTLGCSDSYCDGPAGHDGQHFQWIPE